MKKVLMAMVAGILSACMVTGCSVGNTSGWQTYNIGDKVRLQVDPSWDIYEDEEYDSVDFFIEAMGTYGEVEIYLNENFEGQSVTETIQFVLDSVKMDETYEKAWPVKIGGKTAFHLEGDEYNYNRYIIALDNESWVNITTSVDDGPGEDEVEETIGQVLDTIRFS